MTQTDLRKLRLTTWLSWCPLRWITGPFISSKINFWSLKRFWRCNYLPNFELPHIIIETLKLNNQALAQVAKESRHNTFSEKCAYKGYKNMTMPVTIDWDSATLLVHFGLTTRERQVLSPWTATRVVFGGSLHGKIKQLSRLVFLSAFFIPGLTIITTMTEKWRTTRE